MSLKASATSNHEFLMKSCSKTEQGVEALKASLDFHQEKKLSFPRSPNKDCFLHAIAQLQVMLGAIHHCLAKGNRTARIGILLWTCSSLLIILLPFFTSYILRLWHQMFQDLGWLSSWQIFPFILVQQYILYFLFISFPLIIHYCLKEYFT